MMASVRSKRPRMLSIKSVVRARAGRGSPLRDRKHRSYIFLLRGIRRLRIVPRISRGVRKCCVFNSRKLGCTRWRGTRWRGTRWRGEIVGLHQRRGHQRRGAPEKRTREEQGYAATLFPANTIGSGISVPLPREIEIDGAPFNCSSIFSAILIAS